MLDGVDMSLTWATNCFKTLKDDIACFCAQVRELVDEAILETECVGFNEPGLEKVSSPAIATPSISSSA